MSDVAVSTPAPPNADFFVRFGAAVVAAVFGGLLIWSIAAPIEGAVVAPGIVTVESNRKPVQHLDSGVVAEILVSEGQRVAKDEVLMRLDDTVHGANVALIDAQLAELYARRARLVGERDALAEIAAPDGASEILASSALQANLEGQRQLFEARRRTRATQTQLLEERIVQQEERIAGFRSQIKSIGGQRALILDELAGVRELHEQGFAPKTRLRALERESERLNGEQGALRAGVAEAESVIAEARLEIERVKDAAREESIDELSEVEVNVAGLEERRVAARDALRRTEIRAPHEGRVLGLAVHTPGAVIAAGASLMEIVPEGDKLQISARISPADIERVHEGQATRVRFTSLGARLTPEANGVVRTVSADRLTDQATGAAFYSVLIDLPDPEALEKALRGRPLAPGMPAEAFIRTGARPAILYLLKPLSDAMNRSMKEE